ncbi:MAG: hypothetical protein Kow00109_16090 [Acidobacteriota bacterium]
MSKKLIFSTLGAVLVLMLLVSLHLYFRCPLAAASVSEIPREAMTARLEQARLKGRFIVIDTAANRLYFREGDKVLLEAVCSTGSGVTLVAGERKWTFRTPVGAFRIINKVRDPVWRKPDWAFLEEGRPVPKNEAERYESGVLGEYALGIGDGYFIHGTLYTRTLGTNVTHGCIRLGDEDLEFLARRVRIGTPVFIY